jgi:HlyD family secretion protein
VASLKGLKVAGISLVLLGGAGALGFWIWKRIHAPPEISYKTEPIDTRRIAARVTASGTLQATVTVQVGAQVSGRIEKLFADYNSTVKKGQLIAKLDPQLYEATVEQARANYVENKAGVTKAAAQQKDAELALARTKALSEQTLASAADLQSAETNLAVMAASTEVAKANLDAAGASLHQAQVNLSYCNIYSPIDGTVISRSVDVGQTVAASLQAPVLFTIGEDLRKMQVHTNVSEGDVGRLQTGMGASFTVDAFPGQRFKGTVGQIRNAAQTVQNVVTYDAVIDVENADLRLRPGMTATVTIVWAEKSDVFAVANTALRFRPPPDVPAFFESTHGTPGDGSHAPAAPSAATSVSSSGAPLAGGPTGRHRHRDHGDGGESEPHALWVLRDGRPEALMIKTGLTDGTVTEIVGDLVQTGDQAIVDVSVGGKVASGAPSGNAPRFGRMF